MSNNVVKRLLRPYKRPVMRVAEAAAFYGQMALGGKRAALSDRPRILICDENEPPFDLHAGGARMHEIVKILASRAELWFTPLRPHDRPEYRQDLVNIGVHILPTSRLRYGLRTLEFSSVLVSRVEVGGEFMHIIRKHAPGAKIIFDTVDIASVRLQREYEVTGDPIYKREVDAARRLEFRLAETADELWCVTEADAAHIREIANVPSTRVVPTIHVPRGSSVSFQQRSGLLFLGGLHRPNADAVRFFANEIMPKVSELLPAVPFDVAGSYDSVELEHVAREDVCLIGYAPDLDSLFAAHRVFVCPLRYGSGMKGKIGEAMAAGLPVVTTTIGAEGMGLIDGDTALIRDDPAEFATAVATLYNDAHLWHRLSTAALRHVAENYSPEAVAATIDSALRDLGVLTDNE